MVIKMNVSWIKSSDDNMSFNVFKNLGLNVVELDNLEETDNTIKELIKEEYKTIVISNEVASFSEDIIKKYNTSKDINIIITPSKR